MSDYGDKVRLTYSEKLKNCRIKLYESLTSPLRELLLMIHMDTLIKKGNFFKNFVTFYTFVTKLSSIKY